MGLTTGARVDEISVFKQHAENAQKIWIFELRQYNTKTANVRIEPSWNQESRIPEQ